jgi:hypothetical protein
MIANGTLETWTLLRTKFPFTELEDKTFLINENKTIFDMFLQSLSYKSQFYYFEEILSLGTRVGVDVRENILRTDVNGETIFHKLPKYCQDIEIYQLFLHVFDTVAEKKDFIELQTNGGETVLTILDKLENMTNIAPTDTTSYLNSVIDYANSNQNVNTTNNN